MTEPDNADTLTLASGFTEHSVWEEDDPDSAANVDLLKDLCMSNSEFFAADTSENGQRLYICFLAIRENLDLLTVKMTKVGSRVHEFDFNEDTPGNGYRSFLRVANSGIKYTTRLTKKIHKKRASPFFRKSQYTKDIEACAHLVASLDACFKHLEILLSLSNAGNLFPSEGYSPKDVLAHYDDINQYCFYGRCLGFQYCESIKNVMQFITMSLAIFSEIYYHHGSIFAKATSSVVATSKYLSDPEQRARRIVNVIQNADVYFCKAFWTLSENELINNMPYVAPPKVAVDQVILLPPEPLKLQVNDKEVEVPIPFSHIGTQPIQVRLISYEMYEGIIDEDSGGKCYPPSRGLLVHCHGGGFVAQSSLSHECYLREWSKRIQVPILSIDYSLAPEAPFPRALEEVTYAYCWALKNCERLGSTGERIVAAGDSAGANLLLATTLHCIHLGVPPPMGLFVAYAPTLINCAPSPARLLCMMDPLLPFGFMMRCLKAYACLDDTPQTQPQSGQTSDDSFEEFSESDLMDLRAHKSPGSDKSDTLTSGSLNSNESISKDKDLLATDKGNRKGVFSVFLDSTTESDGTRIPLVRKESPTAMSVSSATDSISSKVSNYISNLKWRINSWVAEKTEAGFADLVLPRPSSVARYVDFNKQSKLLDELQFNVPTDPYLSPFCASKEDLQKFPPVRALTVHLDPCLDDCVMFCRRLKDLNKDVNLEILSDLPHGFLNFSLVSKEAFEGSKICSERIIELLDLSSLPPLQ